MAYGVHRLICAAAFALLAAPAFADISAFNAAVQKGDYRAAVAAANETWPSIDRAGPDAATAAREFGWIAMLAGQPSTALTYAKFLVEQGGALTHPDAKPQVSRVLHDWATLAGGVTPVTRARLLTSLQQRAAIAGRDLISARAAQTLYAEAWAAGDWTQAGAAAELGIRFLDELGATTSPSRYELRRGMAVSAFMRVKTPEAYNAVYDIAADLYDQIAATPDGPIRNRLESEYFSAVAWGDVLYGALGSRQKSTPDRRNTINAGKKSIAEILYPAPGDAALPRCRISLARNFDSPGFPFLNRFKDLGGEVIYALDVEAGGLFSNPRLLVAAPHKGFAESVEDVLTSWRWQVDGATTGCRIPDVHILTFEFTLGK
jgi:hypothetical protein